MLLLSVVRSVEGGAVQLPCDITSSNNDSVYLVLWYRKESGTPIYRYNGLLALKFSDISIASEYRTTLYKRLAVFPSPAGMSLTKLLLDRNK
jgi:hypothetical protein